MSRRFAIFIYAATAAFFGLFFLYPIWHTVSEAFVSSEGKFTFSYIGEVFRNPIYTEGLLNSLKMGFFSTVLSV